MKSVWSCTEKHPTDDNNQSLDIIGIFPYLWISAKTFFQLNYYCYMKGGFYRYFINLKDLYFVWRLTHGAHVPFTIYINKTT